MKTFIPKPRANTRRGWYCGPHAISVLTGASFEVVRAAINRVRRRPSNQGVMGVSNGTMSTVLRWLGKEMVKYRVTGDPTLKAWLRDADRKEGRPYLIEVTNHYVVVIDDWLIDNHTRGKVNINFAPHLKKRVKRVWRIDEY